MAIKTTTIAVSVHQDNESPIFGKGCTHIRVEDEAGGPFLNIYQPANLEPDDGLRLDMDELEEILKVSRRLMSEHQVVTLPSNNDK